LTLALAACGGDDSESPAEPDPAAEVEEEQAEADDQQDDSDTQQESAVSGDPTDFEYTLTAGDATYQSFGAYSEPLDLSLRTDDGATQFSLEVPFTGGEPTGTFAFDPDDSGNGASIGGAMIPDVGMGRLNEPTGSVTIDAFGETVSGSFEVSGTIGGEAVSGMATFSDIPLTNPQAFALQTEYNAALRGNNATVSIEFTAEEATYEQVPLRVNFRQQPEGTLGPDAPATYNLMVGTDNGRYQAANPDADNPNQTSVNLFFVTTLAPGEYPLENCSGSDLPEDAVCAIVSFFLPGGNFNIATQDPGTITIDYIEPLTATVNVNLVSLNPADIENSPTGQTTIIFDDIVLATLPQIPAEE
jgi:hypothetical protein